MADEFAQWLEQNGLSQYAPAFADNKIDFDVLPNLSEDHLEKLGLPLGDRLRLQAAIKELSPDAPPIRPDAAPTPRREPQPAEAQRRQLTVLFCDLVGSTALSSRLDPEDMRDVLRAYQDACSTAIARYDGYVAKFMGDGVYSYFGYPTAHEDDAERAINAGLGIVRAVGALEHDLQVRFGIATGTVAVGDIVGEGASEEANVVGEAPNLAARLQELAEPDTVVIGEATHRLAGGLFETTDFGRQNLKGFAEPTGAWAVVRSHRAESRFEATRGAQLTSFMGREEQVEILLRRWRRAKAGEGQVVLISGEPGIGKSRLVQALQERIVHDSYLPITLQCSSFHVHSAFHPLIELIERTAGFEAGDTNEAKLGKLEAWLGLVDVPLDEVAPLYASLLDLPAGDRYPPLDMSPQRQKEMMLNAHAERFQRLPSERPMLFLVEDAHWMDPTSMELLDRQIERVPGIAALILITYRPEFVAPWTDRSHVTSMTLNRLDRRDAAAMTDVVTAGGVLPDDVRAQIIEKTDGVPLFIEEMTRSVLESAYGAADPGGAIRVPETLQDSLEARLDRLGPAKDVAQIGAAIGRTFDFDLLARVVPVDGRTLEASLGVLVRSRLVSVRGEPPRSTYTFSHALIQDTAYNSLLRSRRTELHGRIVAALEQDFPEIVSSGPEILAHHCTQAALGAQAIDYWLDAGRRAMSRSANAEANGHLNNGLAVLESLPESSQRDRQELLLQTTLGMSFIASAGFGSPDVERAFRRARLLCQDVGDTPDLIPVLWGTWWFHEVRAELETAGELAQQLHDLARLQQDVGALLPACRAVGQTAFWIGDLETTRRQLEQAIAIYQPDLHRSHTLQFGQDPSVAARNFLSHCLWFLGYPDQGLARMREGLALEAQISHPFSHAFALCWASSLHIFRGELRDALEHADAALTLASDQGFPFFVALATILHGAALAEQGEAEAGIAEIRGGLDMYRFTGANSEIKLAFALIAEAHAKVGQFDEGLRLVTEALAEPGSREVLCYEAELHRLKGEFLLARNANADQVAEAEASFHDAIEIARSQSAKSWELRAATSLARLWQSQGKLTDARDLLAPVYDWFTEGFDTADLKEAKTLLDKLS